MNDNKSQLKLFDLCTNSNRNFTKKNLFILFEINIFTTTFVIKTVYCRILFEPRKEDELRLFSSVNKEYLAQIKSRSKTVNIPDPVTGTLVS